MHLTEFVPQLLIPMFPETVQTLLADNQAVLLILSQSEDTNPFLAQHPPSRLLVIADPYQLPLMPITGLHTVVVSSPIVDQASITPLLLLVILAVIGSSKTHGVDLGENPVISD